MKKMLLAACALAALTGPLAARADAPQYTIVIQNHRFEPAELTVPAGERVKLVVDNRDATAEEFDSYDLRREKVVPGGTKGEVWIGPLEAGSYAFIGEYHAHTAKGRLIAK